MHNHVKLLQTSSKVYKLPFNNNKMGENSEPKLSDNENENENVQIDISTKQITLK